MSRQEPKGKAGILVAIIATVLVVGTAKSCALRSPKAVKLLKSRHLLEANRKPMDDGKNLEFYDEPRTPSMSDVIGNMDKAKSAAEAASELNNNDENNNK
jgi:hypothetical protein